MNCKKRHGQGGALSFSVNFCMEFMGHGVNAADALVLVGGLNLF